MRIHLKNNPAKFHLDPIWNDGAFGFFSEKHRSNNNKKKKQKKEQQDEYMDMGSVPSPKIVDTFNSDRSRWGEALAMTIKDAIVFTVYQKYWGLSEEVDTTFES